MSIDADAIVIAAGAAGLTAAYHLVANGLSVKVLEADSRVGGRLKKDDTLADFPVDLGAEWITPLRGDTPQDTINAIVDYDVVSASGYEMVRYNIPLSTWNGTAFSEEPTNWNDHKWVDSTWFDFFNDNIASAIPSGDIVLGCQVTAIDYSTAFAPVVTCDNGNTYNSNYVIVSVPMKVLQDGGITFTPGLPADYQEAINDFSIGSALRLSMKFSDTFYPLAWRSVKDIEPYSSSYSSELFSDFYFSDQTYGQTTTQSVLALFAYGVILTDYNLIGATDDEVLDFVLAELDAIFDDQATAKLEGAVVQNWANDAWGRTGYTRWIDEDCDTAFPEYAVDLLLNPLAGGTVFFAGEHLPVDSGYEWGYASGAAMSGRQQALKIVNQYSEAPSAELSSVPIAAPSSQPSAVPSVTPSFRPSPAPTSNPTTQPTAQPSAPPTPTPQAGPSLFDSVIEAILWIPRQIVQLFASILDIFL